MVLEENQIFRTEITAGHRLNSEFSKLNTRMRRTAAKMIFNGFVCSQNLVWFKIAPTCIEPQQCLR